MRPVNDFGNTWQRSQPGWNIRFEVLIETYEESFGSEAADAFRKAIVARHAGIEVVAEQPDKSSGCSPVCQPRKSRASSALPLLRPLRSSVAAGIFGRDEEGKPIRPSAEEVRAITEQQAESMIEMNDDELRSAVTKYAEDFGSKAAGQLERFVLRQQRLQCHRR